MIEAHSLCAGMRFFSAATVREGGLRLLDAPVLCTVSLRQATEKGRACRDPWSKSRFVYCFIETCAGTGARASRPLVWALQKGAAAIRGGYKAVAAISGAVALAVATLPHHRRQPPLCRRQIILMRIRYNARPIERFKRTAREKYPLEHLELLFGRAAGEEIDILKLITIPYYGRLTAGKMQWWLPQTPVAAEPVKRSKKAPPAGPGEANETISLSGPAGELHS